MADPKSFSRFPWSLHLQKLGLELKCALCLSLFNRPMLLPCDHIFCNCCIPRSECFVCKAGFVDGDLRPAPYMENLVTIYRSLDATFCANMSQPISSDTGKTMDHPPSLVKENSDDKSEALQEGNSSNGQSIFSLMANKRVQVQINHSIEDAQEKTEKLSLPNDGDKCKESELHNKQRVNHSSQAPCSQLSANREGLQAPEKVINHIVQLSPDSPPSFGITSTLDDDGSENCAEKYPTQRSVKRNFGNQTGKEVDDGPASGVDEEAHVRGFKKQKKENYKASEMIKESYRASEAVKKLINESTPVVSGSENVEVSNSESEPKSGVESPTTQNPSNSSEFMCAFCQSARIAETTGPMLHYKNGNPVVGDKASHPNAIHVHRKCVEWAPEVYYDGEIVKNLKAEVRRGAQLKCSSCGIKGAALGCYVKSCRKTFHVPCAVETDGCHWDLDNFNVLCPAHASAKVPNEKKFGKQTSKKLTKNTASAQKMAPQQIAQPPKCWVGSPKGAKDLVLCGSALPSEEKILLLKFARMIGATVTKFWSSKVTHLIASTNKAGACTRTLKFLMAIANGKWILSVDWIKASIEAKHPVNEEPFEVSLDNHGCLDGPKTGRLRVLDNVPKLFNGINIHFSGDFVSGYKEDLEDLVKSAGGNVLKSKEELVDQGLKSQEPPSIMLVVYNIDPPQGCQLGEEVSILLKRLEEAQELAAESGSLVIAHTWLLESMAACKVQPFFPS